jgi:hypothetical protein
MASDNFYDSVLRLTVRKMDGCHGIPLTQHLTSSLSVHFMQCSSVVMLHRTARNDILYGLEPFLTPVTLLFQVS